MRRNRVIPVVCFILAGTCAGLCVGLIIAAQRIPSPTMPESIRQAMSQELVRIDDETGGMLENRDFSENKWLSMTYRQWFYSLSGIEQNVIRFHDDAVQWGLWLMGIGVFMVIAGALLRSRAKTRE